jgi:proteasome lid subunit RPN8/RPN11
MSSLDVRSIDDKELRKAKAPATKQEFRVFLSEVAFDRAVERGDGDTTREVGGVLYGELLRDEAGPFLQIDGTIDALHAEEKGAELTFTHATWEHIHKEMDSKHQDKRLVGWYHTHPGFGIFLSDRDQFIHKSFFNLPFQVAFVYDPKSREHGMFTWHDNEVWRARRYWIGPREQAWDGQRAPVEPTADKAKLKSIKLDLDGEGKPGDGDGEARAPREEFNLGGSIGPLILIGVVLLLVGGFVGRWLGIGSANEVLVQAQLEVAKAKIEGQQSALTYLQNDLLGTLRDTMGDEGMRAPVMQAIQDLDQAIAMLPAEPPPPAATPPAAGSAAQPAGGAAAPGTGSTASAGSAAAPAAGGAGGSGSGSPPGVGSAAAPIAVPAMVPVPGIAAAPPPGVTAPAATPATAALIALSTQLREARAELWTLLQRRYSAHIVLDQLEHATRRGAELRADLNHDVAEQRSGLGNLYAELAGDAAKAKELDRAKRLLSTAARLDPGNWTRYQNQLQSYDKAASLPRDTSDPAQGAAR